MVGIRYMRLLLRMVCREICLAPRRRPHTSIPESVETPLIPPTIGRGHPVLRSRFSSSMRMLREFNRHEMRYVADVVAKFARVTALSETHTPECCGER